MASPKKRKVRKQIGRVLAKGGTATEATFGGAGTPATAAQLENLLEIGLFGHDGDGGFTHGSTGSKLKNNHAGASLAEDAGLETLAEVAARYETANWDTRATRFYLTDDTTAVGMAAGAGNRATANAGILHCPAGPDAQTVPKLEDVSNGSAIDFHLRPTTWVDGARTLIIFWESGDANTSINFRNADNGTSITTKSGVNAAGANSFELACSADNDTDGIIIRVTSTGTGTTALAGWQVAWDNVAD